jgi:hypothetical protein
MKFWDCSFHFVLAHVNKTARWSLYSRCALSWSALT